MGVTADIKYVHLPMEKGDTIFFHPLLWYVLFGGDDGGAQVCTNSDDPAQARIGT